MLNTYTAMKQNSTHI